MATAAAPRAEDDRREEESEEEVESDEEGGSEEDEAGDPCGSVEDPTFDPSADGDRKAEAALWSGMARLSISARKGRKGGSEVAKMGKEENDLLAMVDKLMSDGQLEKLKVYECKAYLRMHKLRLSGKKEVLLNRIREHLQVKNEGDVMYPVSSFVLNCQGDSCKSDVVMFEQNIYKRKKGAPRGVKGRLCGQRTNAGRIIKESYGERKQQHTFTIEILWSKGYKPWPPLHPLLIKGRNLYKDKTMRQPWPDEEERKRVLDEKHTRGFVARKLRAVRINEKEIAKKNRIKENRNKKQENRNNKSSQDVLPQQKVSTSTVQLRSDERIISSLHHQEPGNTRQQQIPSKQTTTKQLFHCLQQPPYSQQHNEMLPQKGTAGTSTAQFIQHQAPSVKHDVQLETRQQPKFSRPTPTQHIFPNPQQHPKHHHHNGVLPQVGTGTTTVRQDCFNRQALPQQHRGSENTRQQQTVKYPQHAPNHQNHNEVILQEVAAKASRASFNNHQNNTFHSAEHDGPAFQPHGKLNQHTKTYQHGSNGHQHYQHGSNEHQHTKTHQHGSNGHQHAKTYQHDSNGHQHANTYQHGSNGYQHARTDHQLQQPLRPRNQDYYHRDQNNDQDHRDYGQATQDQYHAQHRQHQNHYVHRQTGHDQHHHQNHYHYHAEQNHYQNYHDYGPTNTNQYSQQFQRLKLCYYYQDGVLCPYGQNCKYSHGD